MLDARRKGPRTTSDEARPKGMKGVNPVIGTNWVKNSKCGGIFPALDTRGAHSITIKDVPILEQFQVHRNGKSRFMRSESCCS